MLKGFVLTTLNKLPQVKPDLVRTDDDWEDWGMEDLLKALQRWLKRNKNEVPPKRHDDKRDRRQMVWYTRKRIEGEQKERANPIVFTVKRITGENHVTQWRHLKRKYEEILTEQLVTGIVEKAPERPTGERMLHKPVIREDATTTKVRMVFDASAKPHPLVNSINDCMFTGRPLQPLIWDIMIRVRMSTNILLADIQKALMQIGIKVQDRDAFRFLFNINGVEQHLRFARVPFGVEASPSFGS